jgi:hypothetical protein
MGFIFSSFALFNKSTSKLTKPLALFAVALAKAD